MTVWKLLVLVSLSCIGSGLSMVEIKEQTDANQSNISKVELQEKAIEIRVGFLVGSRRLKEQKKQQPSYSRPGLQLLFAFNHGIRRLNQMYSTTRPNIKFVPIIAETYGNESESIKQTVSLIVKQGVNLIVGPQETCHIEARLASIFNVLMVSHFCPEWISTSAAAAATTPGHLQGSTFVQTKPPNWKIVQRVVSLVRQLLDTSSYPRHLVLLYFKQPLTNDTTRHRAGTGKGSSVDAAAESAAWPQPQPQQQHSSLSSMANDAIQYKLIGELLEIKLNELFVVREKQGSMTSGGRPLTVLNWHTTYHYGFTKNPFRQLIRRHLFQQKQKQQQQQQQQLHSMSISSSEWQCFAASRSNRSNKPPVKNSYQKQTGSSDVMSPGTVETNDRAQAIYIMVGHYYEHLGLMLALNELDLLSQQQNPGGQSSVPPSTPAAANQPVTHHGRRRQSVVIGVDIEPYDERDDSVRFLRGLLMTDETSTPTGGSNSGQQQTQQHHQSSHPGSQTPDAIDLDSVSLMYRSYLGVVPAKPARVVEFFDELRPIGNQTPSVLQQQQQQHNLAALTNQTNLDQSMSTRLLQFSRLPIETLYLYDSLMLVGAYFGECLLKNATSLDGCSHGRQAFQWFQNRAYSSYVTQPPNQEASLDAQAQADGSYVLITRRLSPVNETNPDQSMSEVDSDDFGLVPVGQFVGSDFRVELNVDHNSIDQLWLPLWCNINSVSSKTTEFCQQLLHTQFNDSGTLNDSKIDDDPKSSTSAVRLQVIIVCVAIVFLLLLLAHSKALTDHLSANKMMQQRINKGWFTENDESNFLDIVHHYLISAEMSPSTDDHKEEDDELQLSIKLDSSKRSPQQQTSLVELHCYMFPFPSCKFVHWITALHQLKEMMFQYQSASIVIADSNGFQSTGGAASTTNWLPLNFIDSAMSTTKRLVVSTCAKLIVPRSNDKDSQRGFFVQKHRGTASLRLLLNKYKPINECLCKLVQLNHCNVVKLFGVTLVHCSGGSSISAQSKLARLVVEQPKRGNLREAMKCFADTLNVSEAREFRFRAVSSWIQHLLSGLEYLHASAMGFHGELRATTCLIEASWDLKLSGFHACHMRRSLGDYHQTQNKQHPVSSGDYSTTRSDAQLRLFDELIYAAPEVLENQSRPSRLSLESLQLADLYSFAFILYELLVGKEPWSCLTEVNNSKLLVERVKVDSSFRPPLKRLDSENRQSEDYDDDGNHDEHKKDSNDIQNYCPSTKGNQQQQQHSFDGFDSDIIKRLIRSCWSHSADRRPQTVGVLRSRFESARASKRSLNGSGGGGSVVALELPPNEGTTWRNSEYNSGGCSNSSELMICYARLLEKSSMVRKRDLLMERQNGIELEMKLLPASVVSKLRAKQPVLSQHFDCVSLCQFRFILLPPPTVQSAVVGSGDQKLQDNISSVQSIDVLNEIILDLDKLVATYRGHLYLMDSQVDSALRYLIYAGQPLENDSNLAGQPLSIGAQAKQWKPHHCELLASFALKLSDLVNGWQSTKRPLNAPSIQLKCALHCGPVLCGLLSAPTNASDYSQQQSAGRLSVPAGRKSLVRYVLLGSSMQMVDNLEMASIPQRIQVSAEFRALLLHQQKMSPQSRGELAFLPPPLDGCSPWVTNLHNSRQAFVMIKREAKIQSKTFGNIEAYWLLNGPRLTPSQSIMLLS